MNEDKRSDPVPAALAATPPQVDPAKMEEVFEQHHALVFRAAYRVTGNPADSEDVMQTVFLRLLRRPDPFQDVSEIESYLYRAAVNAALDLVRSRQRASATPLEETASGHVSDIRQSPEKAFDSGEIRKWLRGAVGRLSPMAAEAFVLRFFEDKKNTEIAELLGTTPSTIAVTLHRTRERLEREYRAELGGVS
jgi:RNA polymerase sigma-70 factor (ECF subfamily)